MELAQATREDIPAIEALLASVGLPLDGFSQHIDHTIVIRDNNIIIGNAALECYGSDALLRSVAVTGEYQGKGFGQELVTNALHHAPQEGIQRVFLLTETAMNFFSRFGFAVIARADVPLSVQQSVEFTSACPASATVMVANVDQAIHFESAGQWQ